MRRLPLLAVVVALAACGGSKHAATTSTQSASPGCTTVAAPKAGARREKKPVAALDPAKTYRIVMQTNCGTFTITLDVKEAPHTTASLVSLVQHGFFDRTIFHRIVPGFVIQGGDPTQTGTGGPGYTTLDTPPKNAKYVHGVVAMAKTAAQPAGTSGSQFFIVTAKDAGLPPDYAVVGRVTKGLGVVDRIGKLGDVNQQPTQVVEIEKATVAES